MFDIPRPFQNYFSNRGLNPQTFLSPASWNDVPHPSTLVGMKDVVQRLLRAVQLKEKVAIFGDYDCDGILSTAILYTTFQFLGLDVVPYLPHRSEGYGLNKAAVYQFARERVRLIVTVDNGIKAHEALQVASRIGVDTLVVDHHQRDIKDPETAFIWDPQYCGTSLAMMVAWQLLIEAGASKFAPNMVVSFNRLSTIATIADCIPLVGPSRKLVQLGLQSLSAPNSPGLKRLLEIAHISGKPSASQLAWGVCPMLNAAGRMSHPSVGFEAITEQDPVTAVARAEHISALNKERKKAQAFFMEKLVKDVGKVEHALVHYDPEFPPGLVGILAGRAAEIFHVPAFVLTSGTSPELAVGSGRTANGINLVEMLANCGNIFTKFGGHPQAAGVTLPVAMLSEFQMQFSRLAAKTPHQASSTTKIDGTLSIEEINQDFLRVLDLLEPFGQGNPPPCFVIENVTPCNISRGMADLVQNGRSIRVFTRGNIVDPDRKSNCVVEFESKAFALKVIL